MAVIMLDTHVASHAKHLEAGAEACWLWAMAIGWSKMHLTDGVVPGHVLGTLGRFSRPVEEVADRLVAVGLFERSKPRVRGVKPVPITYTIHDFLAHNDDAETVRLKREQSAKRQMKWRKKREPNENRHAVTDASTDALSTCVLQSPRAGTRAVSVTVYKDDPRDGQKEPPDQTGRMGTDQAAPRWAGGRLHDPHRAHAECGPVCLPSFLFAEFVQRCGKPDPDAYVRQWAQREIDQAQAFVDGGGVIGDKPLPWWRARWEATHGQASAVRPAPDFVAWDCPHEPHCGSHTKCETLQALEAARANVDAGLR